MTALASNLKPGRPCVPNSALAKEVLFNADMTHVRLTDGRIISVPLLWVPTLHAATHEQREHCELGAGGRGLHWPDLDDDSL